jgi:hypothetical protein
MHGRMCIHTNDLRHSDRGISPHRGAARDVVKAHQFPGSFGVAPIVVVDVADVVFAWFYGVVIEGLECFWDVVTEFTFSVEASSHFPFPVTHWGAPFLVLRVLLVGRR